MKKRKRRSISASRAASLKGWRTRRIMRQRRFAGHDLIRAFILAAGHMPTIDRIPKVEWK